MKQKTLFVTFLAITVFAIGCKPSTDDSTKTAADQLDKVKTETKEAAKSMKNYAYAEKAEFIAAMKAQLAKINKDMDELDARMEKASDAVKADAKPKIQALRDEASELGRKLDEAGNATESTWDAIKQGTQNTWDALEKDFQKSRQWLSDKIAP